MPMSPDDLRTRIDAVTRFLSEFENPTVSHGRLQVRDGLMPWIETSPAVTAFVETLYEHGWVTPFDWGEWQDIAARYVESPALAADADIETIQKLLTTHVRKDRFCDGHLVAMIECGHIAACLRRLQVLRHDL